MNDMYDPEPGDILPIDGIDKSKYYGSLDVRTGVLKITAYETTSKTIAFPSMSKDILMQFPNLVEISETCKRCKEQKLTKCPYIDKENSFCHAVKESLMKEETK